MTELTLSCGSEGHLVATLTWPQRDDGRPPATVVVLTNSGVIPRFGPNRINVALARRLAQLGVASVRFDMSGLGDSRRASGDRPMLDQWVHDTRAVMDMAQARFGCERFAMVGFCSGAEVAHLAALEDERLQAAVLWDMYAYPTWESRWRTFVFRVRRAGLRGILTRVARRLAPGPARPAPQRSADAGRVPPAAEFSARLHALSRRGTRLLVMYSGGEPEWYNHAGQFQRMFGPDRPPQDVETHFLWASDHLLTQRSSRQAFITHVTDWLGRGGLLT